MSTEKVKGWRSPGIRRLLNILGLLLTLAALFFAFQRVWSIGRADWEAFLAVDLLLVILFGTVLHALNNILLGWAWQKWLVFFGASAARPRLSIAVYARTQIAKYLPGNFIHLTGRHVLGNKVGYPHPALVGALVYEIIGLLSVAGVISLLAYPGAVALETGMLLRLLFMPLLLVLPVLVQAVVNHFSLARRFGFPQRSIRAALRGLLPVWALYALYFIVDGSILFVLVGATTGAWTGIPFLYVLSSFSISWVLGYITPGAPAGLGVRDAVMILILTNFIGAPSAAFVALVARLIVTLGDVVTFLLSYLIAGRTGLQNSIE